MDFLHDALANGRKVRTLSIEDAYTREMLAIEVDTPCRRCGWCECWTSYASLAGCPCGS